MRTLLSKCGIDVASQVDFCIHGGEALEMARFSIQYGFKYRLILTDFNMPVMDGLEASTKLREILGTEVPIIGITGYAS